MNLFLFNIVLIGTLVPARSFSFLEKLGFGGTEKSSDIMKAQAYFAHYMGSKLLHADSTYKVLKLYSTKLIDKGNGKAITMDLLLHKVATSESSRPITTYPLNYLQCDHVELAERKGEFTVTSYNCPSLQDADSIPRDFNKNIVAQAANNYAVHLTESHKSKYIAWRVLHVNQKTPIQVVKGKTHINFSMKIQLVKKNGILNETLKVLECSGVVVQFKGNLDKFERKQITIKQTGKCKKIAVPRVAQSQNLENEK